MKQPSLEAPFLKALLYGAPGSTKTRTAASAVLVEDMSPVLMLESAGNPISLRDYRIKPTIFTMESLNDYALPYDYLLRGQQPDHPFRTSCEKAGIRLEDYYQTVIIDGITEVQRFAFRAVVPGMDVLPGQIPPDTEIRHFNKVLAIMTNWAYKYITLDMHVILTSLEAEKQQGSMTTIYKRPLLWGQSQGEIASYAYLVMRLAQAETMDTRTKSVVSDDLAEANASQVIGFVKATSSFYAKQQYGMVNSDGSEMKYMFNPDMQKIWQAINAQS